MSQYEYDFEHTDLYRLVRDVARWMRRVQWPAGEANLRVQGIRAMDSVALNTGEGWVRRGRAGRNQLRIALASAGEVLVVLDLVDLPQGREQQQKLRRIGAMLAKDLMGRAGGRRPPGRFGYRSLRIMAAARRSLCCWSAPPGRSTRSRTLRTSAAEAAAMRRWFAPWRPLTWQPSARLRTAEELARTAWSRRWAWPAGQSTVRVQRATSTRWR